MRGAPPTGGAPRYYFGKLPRQTSGRRVDGRRTRSEQPGLSRFLLPIGGLVALGLCVAGLLVLLDPHGGANLLARIYEALGNSSGAADLENGQGDQVLAKLILAVIALGVGVGGIWLLFLGVGALVGLMRPSRRDRILPWVFVGPALALLAVFLLYPAAATVIRSFLDQNGGRSWTTTPSC